MDKVIDVRSDTVTQPGPAMRAAMAAAEVGDDVFGDDPTVNRLQERMAAMTGMEAGLFLPSGTQSNLCALMSHCQRGEEYIVGQDAHTYKYEGGGAAVLGSIQPQPLENAADGTIPLAKIRAAVKPDDSHFAITRLIALENTIGGKVLPEAYLAEVRALAKEKGLSTHLDGARVFNAAVKSGRDVKAICAHFDSVSVCLSKGLGAPAGSVLCGSKDLIKSAHRWRKMLGGGMRQAGILAAAGLYALDHHVARLAEDHDNAAHLAAALAEIPALKVTFPDTNILFVDVPAADCAALAEEFKRQGVVALVSPRLRLVTHLDLSRVDIDRLIGIFQAFYRGRT
ncbi:MAG: low-specificity L-threonine aldolase [Betaproteobacteria bacterium]|nr:low-specificity L-threonine aldolase [Betaproteobacteria bacterium]